MHVPKLFARTVRPLSEHEPVTLYLILSPTEVLAGSTKLFFIFNLLGTLFFAMLWVFSVGCTAPPKVNGIN
jgi:hypothetical protein